jgi:hypothetical protein
VVLTVAWFGDVEIPDDLVEAQQKGELVLFVGAGASVGAPSNLPSFWRLAETIRGESELGPIIGSLEGQALDEVLDKVDQDYDVDVHLRAAKLLSPAASAPNGLHRAIGDLASSTCVRIVTTNYDRHLSAALGNSASECLMPIQRCCAFLFSAANKVADHGNFGESSRNPARPVLASAMQAPLFAKNSLHF